MIRQEDLRIEIYRDAGVVAGTTCSDPDYAMKITHLPTGLSVEQRGREPQESELVIKDRLLRTLTADVARSASADETDLGPFDDHKINVSPGWWPLLAEAHRRLSAVYPGYTIGQVKEKWGGLRIYVDAGQDVAPWAQISDIVNDLEDRSFTTCELCGQPGVRRGGGWIKTLCDDDAGGAEPVAMWEKRVGTVTWRGFGEPPQGV